MNYIVLKNIGHQQLRIYPDPSVYEGKLILKTHKLAIEPKHLIELLEYRMDLLTRKKFFLIYDKVKDKISPIDKSIWIESKGESFEKEIMESWYSVQRALESKCGKFRKILITLVNI
jgi:hypothetical protein